MFESDHSVMAFVPPTQDPVLAIVCEKVDFALLKMKNDKVAGADDTSTELWKKCGPAGCCVAHQLNKSSYKL